MFEPTEIPRLFGTPTGVDFPKALVKGLLARTDHAPDLLARVELFVNTSRMQNRVRALFDGRTGFLPRIRLITDLAHDPTFHDLPQPVSPLRRRLELRQLVAALIEKQPDLAPQSAAFDLADSLADLMDEMHSEGVPPANLQTLDVGDMSDHWARSLRFLSLVEQYFDQDSRQAPDVETRQRQVIEKTVQIWSQTPPEHPVIIAGSTGSKGATAMLIKAAARLPQGAVILPGFDYDLPAQTWSDLQMAFSAEDHPQYRFARLIKQLGITSHDVPPWTATQPPSPARNRLVSLALCPAPVTDRWQTEGRALGDVDKATDDLTLIETRTPREEATAIALVLRKSVEDAIPVALITPDRTLTRQVSAALDRWRIEPDDSAGRPLALSAPGRFLRQTAQLLGENATPETLLALLKHPLTHSTENTRGNHLRWTRDLELALLRGRYAQLEAADIHEWADGYKDEPTRQAWAQWVAGVFFQTQKSGGDTLEAFLETHIAISEQIARGTSTDGSGALWDKAAGQKAQNMVSDLAQNAQYGGQLAARAYGDLFFSLLNKEQVHDPVTPHPDIMFWGTLEARVQGAERVILAGLNDGTWPELPGPDPWLNRKMRQDAGLLLPERRVGLSAHDFQQAIATKEVFITRSTRDDDSETIPSRWINRLCNLMGGMSEAGAAALAQMRARGKGWIELANQLDTPPVRVPAAPRPSPAPPVSARPNQLSATAITKLIRDPYAIYAQKVLHLKPLNPLRLRPDALIRGTVLHLIFERYVQTHTGSQDAASEESRLLKIAQDVLCDHVPWPATRILWLARIRRIAGWFVAAKARRQNQSDIIANEIWGQVTFDTLGFTLGAKADRIDQRTDGTLAIYDYKSGEPPTEKMQKNYDKQLLLEAVIAQLGGFRDFCGRSVSLVSYIGLSPQKEMQTDLGQAEIDTIQAEFLALIRAYQAADQGFTSRRAVHKQRFDGDYDHLARFGEWDESTPPQTIKVGQ